MARKDAIFSNVFETLQENKAIQEVKKETNAPKKKTTLPKESDKKVTKKSSKTISKPKVTEEKQEEQEITEVEDFASDIEEDEVGEGDTDLNPSEANHPFGESLLNKFNEKKKKPTIEETHTRNTVFLRNDLHKRMQRLTKNRRGLKTMLVNEAIEAVLDTIEGVKK